MPSPTPLHDLHTQAEAEFQPYGDIEIVSTYGNVPAEYAAIRKACGVLDLPFRGVIELSGKERLPFLNNLLTNQTFDKRTKTGLAAGETVYAFLLNSKTGRIITDLNVIERGQSTLLEMDRRMVEPVLRELERYLFAEQVKITSRIDDLYEIALHGPGGAEAVKTLGGDAIMWHDNPAGARGQFVILSLAHVRAVWAELLSKPNVRPIGWAAFNTARIEAGRPLFGIDFDDSLLPHETGPLLNRAVSFTKGCYPGQEIVARMHARQQVARQIAGIRGNDDALPVAGTKILDDQQNEIGAITSSTISPILSNAAIALALLKRPHFSVGATVNVPAEGQMRSATVIETPFVKT